MPKQLNNGQITQALQRAFGFKGRYIPMLDEVIVPVYVIADPSPASVTRLCAGIGTLIQDNPLTFPFIQLFNPVASGQLINVTAAVATANVKYDLDVRFYDTPGLSLQTTIQFRDRRNKGDPVGEVRIDNAETVLVGDKIAALQIDGAFSQSASWLTQQSDPRQPLAVLEPGQGVMLQTRNLSSVGSDSFEVSFRWLELPLSQTNPLGGLPG